MSVAHVGKRTTNRGIKLSQTNQRVILHGHIRADEAERAWTRVLEAWDLDGTDEETRENILVALAEIIVLQGSSVASDLEAQAIVINDKALPLLALASTVAFYTAQDNPIRVFYRSFRDAIIPCMAYGILLDTGNTTQRNWAMMKYGCESNTVQYAFDMFTDAAPYLGLTSYDLRAGRAINNSFLQVYDTTVRSKGLAVASHDMSSRRANITAESATVNTDANTRLGFNSLR